MKNLKQYQSYKDSKVEWLRNTPDHWEIVKAKRIFIETSIKGFPDEELLAATQTKGVVPKSVYGKTTVTATKNFETLKLVEKGDFVISLRSFQGGIEYAHYRGIISPAYTILQPQEEVVHKYYRYLLKSKRYISGLTLLVTGIREGQNIDTGKFKDSYLPLPPEKEQTTIANFLDYKTEKINRFIQKKKQLIKLLNEQKVAIINQAVTKGIDRNVKMKRSGIEWLGDIPEQWKVSKIKWLTPVKRGASPRPIENPIYFDDNGEFAWVRIADVTASERYLVNTTQKLSDLGNSMSVKQFPGDLFLSIAGSVGKPIITKIKCCIHDGFVWFPLLNVNKEFIYYIFKAGRCYLGLGKMGTQLNLNTDSVGGITIPLPPKKEIDAIVKYLDNETSKIDKTILTIEKEITLTQEYKTALIAEAVTGKIDVRDFVLPAKLENEGYDEIEEEIDLPDEDEEELENDN